MPSFNEPLRNWFGYTRRERRATFILLLLSAALIGLRFVGRDKEIAIEKLPPESGASASGSSFEFKNQASARPVIQAQKKYKPHEIKKLELNTCDSASLERLPGIGPVLSARIIKYRNLIGGYYSVDQLKEVYGLSAETFTLISGRVTADSLLIKKIDINHSGFSEMIRLPYLSRYEVNAILTYRKLNGIIRSPDELVSNKLLPGVKAGKVRPYLEFGQ
jgi:DNA uptake protein ComE-like DNA-binding protein